MDLNQAEVAVTTQHLIDMGQEKDNLLQMSDFGDMGEFLCTCSELFPEEETPEYRYTKWEEIPDLLINREWLCSNFFEIREAMEQLEEPDKDCFFDWCDRYGHDISTEDPHLLVAHYIELYGNAAYIDDEPCPDSTAGMTACCTVRAYQATISTRVFPVSRYSMTITIKAYKHIQDGNQLQRTGNAG